MRSFAIFALTLIAAAVLLLPAAAQSPQMPQPGPEMARLKFLQGKWIYQSTYDKTPMVPNGGIGKGTYNTIPGPGGFSQIADFQEDSPDGVEIGHEVTNWDAHDHVYKTYLFGNSFPECVIRTGHFEGNNLIFDTDFDYGGSKFHFQSITTANADGSITISESSSTAGAALQRITVMKLTRQ